MKCLLEPLKKLFGYEIYILGFKSVLKTIYALLQGLLSNFSLINFFLMNFLNGVGRVCKKNNFAMKVFDTLERQRTLCFRCVYLFCGDEGRT